MKFHFFYLAIITFLLFIACHEKTSTPKANPDSTIIKDRTFSDSANKLYSEGMKLLDERISIQSTKPEQALDINLKAIQKFSDAYKIDTTQIDPVLFASECTMYSRDYKNCIHWTLKLKELDTSQENIKFCSERIKYCNKLLKLKKRP